LVFHKNRGKIHATGFDFKKFVFLRDGKTLRSSGKEERSFIFRVLSGVLDSSGGGEPARNRSRGLW